MTTTLEKVLNEVLMRVNPNSKDQKKIQNLAKKLIKKVKKNIEKIEVNADVRLEGSVAKNTWLKDFPEIDVFIQVPKTIPRESFGTVYLEIGKNATQGYKQIERFAEHPYLEAKFDDVWINIVPCYKVKAGKWISATDRTPFHTDYIKNHLDVNLVKEVRLLKRFMKGIRVYGAEIKVGGFSGYLCELLVLNYGSFVDVLRSASDWKKRTIIDYEGHYKGNSKIKEKFVEPLIIVDPVDKERNVAAAIRKERYNEFIAASRAFLKRPHLNFFYPPETKIPEFSQLVNRIKSRGSTIVFLKFNGTAVPDVLWGQLYKSQRAIRKLVLNHDFNIFRESVWSNEEGINIFIFEIENHLLPNLKTHIGPPLEKKIDCEKFLNKYNGTELSISGPRIENGRWVVDTKRNYLDLVKLLEEKLTKEGKSIGVAKFFSKSLSISLEIFVNDEIFGVYSAYSEFARFLIEYLNGKPRWLQ